MAVHRQKRDHDGVDPRRHRGLHFVNNDRPAAVRSALVELLNLRAIDRDRFKAHRADRQRKTSRRALGDGLAVCELDREIEKHGTLDERSVDAALTEIGEPVDVEAREQAGAYLRDTFEADAASAAWFAAVRSIEWSPDDYDEDNRPTETGLRKLEATRARALQGFLVLRAGLGSVKLGSIDSWWLLLARTWLADHEIGGVIEAADWLGEGPHDDRAIDRAIKHAGAEDVNVLARRAVERWQRMRRHGWSEVRRPPATKRTQIQRGQPRDT